MSTAGGSAAGQPRDDTTSAAKTSRPFETYSIDWMENWGWSQKRSVDDLAAYISFALRPLKNAGLEITGVTSPGGFGGKNLPNYSAAVLQACRDVFKTEIPFYLKKVHIDEKSVAPEVLCASGLESDDPKCVVSIVGGSAAALRTSKRIIAIIARFVWCQYRARKFQNRVITTFSRAWRARSVNTMCDKPFVPMRPRVAAFRIHG